jgi:hypothetical protein
LLSKGDFLAFHSSEQEMLRGMADEAARIIRLGLGTLL